MPAEIIEILASNPDDRKIDKIMNCLLSGGIIIYPTDTVYAMGCMASNTKAVERLCRLKNTKPEQNRFSIVCADIKDISTYAKVSNQAFRLLKKIFPGPYTVILPATGDLPKILQTKRKSIGIRIPDHKIPHLLTEKIGGPLITTSVKDDIDDIIEYPNEIPVIYEQNQHKVDLIIDAGWCGIEPSTVLDLSDDTNFKVIREGVGDPDVF
jgi:tRNA threonylcarbamoyl adenosine modification protein (Sua5/YciO/YrdC/YwlC family)